MTAGVRAGRSAGHPAGVPHAGTVGLRDLAALAGGILDASGVVPYQCGGPGRPSGEPSASTRPADW
jgi:hypothetical protein